jgi:hypothetical protein
MAMMLRDGCIAIGETAQAEVVVDLLRLVETRLLIQSSSGGGKSNALRVIVEKAGQINGVQVIVIDPEGELHTLRAQVEMLLVGASGSGPGGADLAADPATSSALGRRLRELRCSAVVDLFGMPLRDQRTYVRGLIQGLMGAGREHWGPTLVVIDEAHRFAPEGGKECASADEVANLMSAGRKRGLCGILATQRLSKLDKDAAAECGNIAIGRTGLDVDQKRVADALGFRSTAERAELRELQRGEFWLYGPAFEPGARGPERAMLEAAQTRAPARGEKSLPVSSGSAHLASLAAELADLAEQSRGEINDLDTARARIGELERDLANAIEAGNETSATSADLDAARAESESLREQIQAYKFAVACLRAAIEAQARDGTRLIEQMLMQEREAVERLERHAEKNPEPATVAPAPVAAATVNGAHKPRPAARPEWAERVRDAAGPAIDLSTAQLGLLDAAQWYLAAGIGEPSRHQLGLRAGISPVGGYFRACIGPLIKRGLLETSGAGLRLTEAGAALVSRVIATPRLADLHSAIEGMLKGEPSKRLLRQLIACGRSPITRRELGQACEIDAAGGYFRACIGPLSTLKLFEKTGPGEVRASDVLFPKGVR